MSFRRGAQRANAKFAGTFAAPAIAATSAAAIININAAAATTGVNASDDATIMG